METQKPEIIIESDFDGFFQGLVEEWVQQHKGPFKNRSIVISAGPYRGYDVRYDSTTEGVLKLDFYSPCRIRGGPDLTPAGVAEMVGML